MLIEKDSPLRRLPSELNMKQTLFLDAIRYCIEMADTSYRRLQETLLNLTKEYKQNKETSIVGTATVNALLDAWSIVDSVNRLRTLLDQMPMVKKKGPGLVSFRKQTDGVENLRNIIQHLNHEIDKLIEKKSTALGILNWVVALDSVVKRCYVCCLQPGTLFKRSATLINPAGKSMRYPIDQITLVAGSESVCLSDVMDQVAKLVSSLEKELQGQFKGLPQAGADLLLILEFDVGDTK